MNTTVLVILIVAYILARNLPEWYKKTFPPDDTADVEIFKSSQTGFIKSRMTYYSLLDEDDQNMFLAHTFRVMNSVVFVSREEGFEVTDEMRVLVSASIAQLTLGWTDVKPPHLEQVDLLNDAFFSRLVGRDVKGLTLPGRVMLSWKYFQEGYRIDNDKINLGLHELAHAVWDEINWNQEIEAEFEPWKEIANAEFQKMQRHIDCGFFREYAGTNIKELWACSVECFFEAPQEFQQKLPDLYASMASIINQDMAGRARRRPFIRQPIPETLTA